MQDSDTNHAENSVELKHEGAKAGGSVLSDQAIRAVQGNAPEKVHPARQGSNFERWARDNVFGNDAHRLSARIEDNLHLDKFGDGLGLTKDRRSDGYINEHGEIWELKSGYEKGGIKPDQLCEYLIM